MLQHSWQDYIGQVRLRLVATPARMHIIEVHVAIVVVQGAGDNEIVRASPRRCWSRLYGRLT